MVRRRLPKHRNTYQKKTSTRSSRRGVGGCFSCRAHSTIPHVDGRGGLAASLALDVLRLGRSCVYCVALTVGAVVAHL